MIAIGMGQLPKHDNWADAIWSGTKAAAEAVCDTGEKLVSGGFDVARPDGKGKERVKIDRSFFLKALPGRIANAYNLHTYSVREPEKFKQFQESARQFQHGSADATK